MSLLSSIRQFSSDGEKLFQSNLRNSSYLRLITFPEKLIVKGEQSKATFFFLFIYEKELLTLRNLLEIAAE